MRIQNRVPANLLAASLLLCAGAASMAGSHTWQFTEAFSSPDGNIWFIEMGELNGANAENGVNHPMSSTSTGNVFGICILTDAAPGCGVSNTALKRILFASPGYAELAPLQGLPAPDQVVPTAPFFNALGDTLKYNTGTAPYDNWPFPALPTNCTDSMNSPTGTGASVADASPKNWAGVTNSNINCNVLPPSVVPGTGVAAMKVGKLAADGSSLQLTYNVAQCQLNKNHQIIYGDRSSLPTTPGGMYTTTGAACGIGATSPYVWNATPSAGDGSGLIWWLIVVNNDSNTEGSWGKRDGVNERQGTGTNGSSGECGVVNKNLANTCGG